MFCDLGGSELFDCHLESRVSSSLKGL
jgi:hypothetical protein